MALAKYLAKIWKDPKTSLGPAYKEKLVEWRAEPAIVRLEHPTRLDRAHALGFKAKQGVFVVRARVLRGGKAHEKVAGGRRSKKFGIRYSLNVSYQSIAQARVAKQYENCEVLNSYWVGQDGNYYWYEVIMADRTHPAVLADPQLSKAVSQRGRTFRGLTSSQKKSRGLYNKGIGAEKVRPSLRANHGRLH
jgi:large subunit ribosomal protein L15e